VEVAIKSATGEVRQHARFNKSTKIWTTTSVKKEKAYNYIPELQKQIVHAKLTDENPLRESVDLAENDPRHIGKHLTDIPKPDTAELFKLKQEHTRKISK
jgi:hypothetical protein